MSLCIYVGRENLPKDRTFIFDVEAAFNSFGTLDLDEELKEILHYIEHAEYIDSQTFQDRTGKKLYFSNLSTGAKALILAKELPESIVNISEAGINVYSILEEMQNASVYLADSNGFDIQVERNDLYLNGKLYDSTQAFNEALEVYNCV